MGFAIYYNDKMSLVPYFFGETKLKLDVFDNRSKIILTLDEIEDMVLALSEFILRADDMKHRESKKLKKYLKSRPNDDDGISSITMRVH